MHQQSSLSDIQLYLDSANLEEMISTYNMQPRIISGFTTNPTLMKTAGIKNYLSFVKDVVTHVKDLPISFEVFSDDLDTMRQQALKLSSIATNVFVKIPITNTQGISTHKLISDLNYSGVLLNVTAIMTTEKIKLICDSLLSDTPIILSVFAGRIADTGVDPLPMLKQVCQLTSKFHQVSVLWASSREILNIFQAAEAGCKIITLTQPLFKKLGNIGKNLNQLSLETVEMFYKDAKTAGYYF